jgi:hypothetical protein
VHGFLKFGRPKKQMKQKSGKDILTFRPNN